MHGQAAINHGPELNGQMGSLMLSAALKAGCLRPGVFGVWQARLRLYLHYAIRIQQREFSYARARFN